MSKRIKNNTGSELKIHGQRIAAGAYHLIDEEFELDKYLDGSIDAQIISGDLIINDGTSDITDITEAMIHLRSVPGGGRTYTRMCVCKTITGPDYVKVCSFIYNGSDLVGKPLQARVILFTNDTADLRLYDITHNKEVGSVTGITDTDPTIKRFTLDDTKIPTQEAIFEVQAKISVINVNKTATVDYFDMRG